MIGPDKKIKLMLYYPMTTGRNFDEILRVLDSMQLTAKHKVATPAQLEAGPGRHHRGLGERRRGEKAVPAGLESRLNPTCGSRSSRSNKRVARRLSNRRWLTASTALREVCYERHFTCRGRCGRAGCDICGASPPADRPRLRRGQESP